MMRKRVIVVLATRIQLCPVSDLMRAVEQNPTPMLYRVELPALAPDAGEWLTVALISAAGFFVLMALSPTISTILAGVGPSCTRTPL